ncbi:MAG: glycosyltransferase, partial [Sphingomonas sp.]
MRQSGSDGQHARTELVIITPVYDDWECFAQLLREIEVAMPASQYDIEVIAVDDCSTMAPAVPTLSGSISGVSVLRLTTNVGHQRAIAVGLVHADSE